MKSRDINLSEHQVSEEDLSNEVAADLTCPITLEFFFEPVVASPCGHEFEKCASRTFHNCPLCRHPIKEFIPAFRARSMLDDFLRKHPEMNAEVYFDLDHFEKIVSNNELKGPIGQRFIRLLQHSTSYLNDVAVQGIQHKKSAIEILSTTSEGLELLRSDKKILALVSEESLQIIVNGKTIQDWIHLEKEDKDELHIGAMSLFRTRSDVVENTIWQRVAYGNEEDALIIIRADPDLVKLKGSAIDWSGRTIDEATPYQAALREGDEVLAKSIGEIYLQNDPIHGKTVLKNQFNEVFPEGLKAHLASQMTTAEIFERDFINPLVDEITNASPEALKAALAQQFDNGSELCNRLNSFREAFHELSHQEKVFNPHLLLSAFKKYNKNFITWNLDQNYHCNALRLTLFWRQVIGFEQRYLPANYAQIFCTGLHNFVKHNFKISRRFNLIPFSGDNLNVTNFFPLSSSCSPGLGFDFAVFSHFFGRAKHEMTSSKFALKVKSNFSKIISNKNKIMQKLISEQTMESRRRLFFRIQ